MTTTEKFPGNAPKTQSQSLPGELPEHGLDNDDKDGDDDGFSMQRLR